MNDDGDDDRRSGADGFEDDDLEMLTSCTIALAVSRFSLEQVAGLIRFCEMLRASKVKAARVSLEDNNRGSSSLLISTFARDDVIASMSSLVVLSSAASALGMESEVGACISSLAS